MKGDQEVAGLGIRSLALRSFVLDALLKKSNERHSRSLFFT